MRKTLEAVGLGALAVLFWDTYRALYGPDPLPDRIPTHFDIAGQPNGWARLPRFGCSLLWLFLSIW